LALFNFDESRFVRIQSGAVALAGPIDQAVGQLLEGGAQNIFFAGTGGAGILMQPASQLLSTQSAIGCYSVMPAELVLTGHPQLSSHSIVVMPSLSGTTRETLAALEYCKQRGARVLALTGHADTPLARAADVSLVNFAEDDTSCESFYLQALCVALSVMRHRKEFGGYAAVLAELLRLPPLLLDVKRAFEARAEQFAGEIQSEPYHMITGAGSTWPEAFYYGMCILEEMQWIRMRPVHASDFFHGALELLDKDVSLIVFQGEDALRPLTERVAAFARDQTSKLHVRTGAAASRALCRLAKRLGPADHEWLIESGNARGSCRREGSEPRAPFGAAGAGREPDRQALQVLR
jgi:fructoselysine-6-phosphate deglycase